MVSATNANCSLVTAGSVLVERANVKCAVVERGGVRTIGEVLAEMLPRYTRIVEANAWRADAASRPVAS